MTPASDRTDALLWEYLDQFVFARSLDTTNYRSLASDLLLTINQQEVVHYVHRFSRVLNLNGYVKAQKGKVGFDFVATERLQALLTNRFTWRVGGDYGRLGCWIGALTTQQHEVMLNAIEFKYKLLVLHAVVSSD